MVLRADTETDRRKFKITVCNYAKYQERQSADDTGDDTGDSTGDSTGDGPTTDRRRYKNKKEKNEKKKEEGIMAGPSGPTAPELSLAPVTKPDPIPYAQIIDHLNSRCGCQYKHTSQATRRSIKARWAEGFRVDDFKRVVDHKHADWSQDAKMCAFLRPETLFSAKFEGYLQAARNGTATSFAGGGVSIPPEQDELLQKVKAARAERERKKALQQQQQGGQHVS